ncbi:MAG: PIN domain-containing protein [Treponema sp.]|nr:PIN domain-containing protein [Treponema sp.]
MKPLRVVLDTNTLVSALLFRRENWSWLRDAWKEGTLIPQLCAATTLELIRVLSYPKFQLAPATQERFLAEILPFCETQPPPSASSSARCRDPTDPAIEHNATASNFGLSLQAEIRSSCVALDCRVSKDQVFLDLAVAAGADFLVSGDKDLLELPDASVRIIAPAELRALL